MALDWITLTDRVGERERVEIAFGSVTEPLPFPVYCGGCGIKMPFGNWYGGYRYKHPAKGECPIRVRFSIRADFAAQVACNVVTRLRGGDPNDTVLDRLQHVDHVRGFYYADQWIALAILKEQG